MYTNPEEAILKNLLSGGYTGELRAVNPKETEVQGVAAFADVKDIPIWTLPSWPYRLLSRCGGDACCGEAGEGVHYPFCRFW